LSAEGTQDENPLTGSPCCSVAPPGLRSRGRFIASEYEREVLWGILQCALPVSREAAELVDTLKGDGPFTVFAPTDEAFAKLPAGTVESLLKPENKDKLKAILLIHVVPGCVMAADIVKLREAKTAGGCTVKISTDGGVTVGTAKGMSDVTKTDIKTSNGVIHVIDAVILPE